MSSAVGSVTSKLPTSSSTRLPEESTRRREGRLPQDVLQHVAVLGDEATPTEHVVGVPVAVHLDDVREHHAVVRTRLEERHLTGELLGRPLVVGVEERDVLAGCGRHAVISRPRHAEPVGS